MGAIIFFSVLFVLVFAVKLFTTLAPMPSVRFLKYIVTPLVLATLFALAAISFSKGPLNMFQTFILLGLVFGIIGDTQLMIDGEDLFLQGMLSFTLTQLMFIAAFSSTLYLVYNRAIVVNVMLVLVFVAVYSYVSFFKNLGSVMKAGIAFYTVIELVMVFCAVSQAHNGITSLAAVGGTLFLISDLLLAWKTFKNLKLPGGSFLVWLTYGAGQYLIVLSAVLR